MARNRKRWRRSRVWETMPCPAPVRLPDSAWDRAVNNPARSDAARGALHDKLRADRRRVPIKPRKRFALDTEPPIFFGGWETLDD